MERFDNGEKLDDNSTETVLWVKRYISTFGEKTFVLVLLLCYASFWLPIVIRAIVEAVKDGNLNED